MQSLSSKENFFIGLSLANSSNCDSSICVMDRECNIILLDKFYFANDIEYFFDTSHYIKNSVICTSVAYDNRILEGKWRIHSKNYKMLGDYFKINRDDWTNRISKRCSGVLLKLKQSGIKVIRADVNQLRQSYNLQSYYLSGTSIDCKNLQTSLKLKFDFLKLPDNMLSFSALEAIICAIFSMEYVNNIKTRQTSEIEGIPVLARSFDN
ncbi:MAG: hypothetical protein IJ877_04535 [Candidatus Gastranaerophilales bacterium]|nr:hypothetical protein [Candidatus Gastranaerophilales bacterium]